MRKTKQAPQQNQEGQAPKPTANTASNEFDRAVKETLSGITDPFMIRRIGLNPHSIKKLPTELQRTLERRLDEVNLAEDEGGEYILHFEYQRDNEPDIIGRMMEYRGILYRKYKKPIIQAVLYYGDEPMKMENEYTDSQTTMHFELIDIKQTSARSMIASPHPEEVIMGVLGNFEKEAPGTVIKNIFEKLKLLANSEIEFQKYSERLIILAKSRKFEDIAEEIRDMFDIEYHPEDFATFRKAKANVERDTTKRVTENVSEQIAVKMLKLGKLTQEEIALTTNLSLEVVQQLTKGLAKGEA